MNIDLVDFEHEMRRVSALVASCAPPPTCVVPEQLMGLLMMASRVRQPIVSRVAEMFGIGIVVHPDLDDEWLLVPHGQSVELAVTRYLMKKAKEPLRSVPKMHGLREAAMEVEP